MKNIFFSLFLLNACFLSAVVPRPIQIHAANTYFDARGAAFFNLDSTEQQKEGSEIVKEIAITGVATGATKAIAQLTFDAIYHSVYAIKNRFTLTAVTLEQIAEKKILIQELAESLVLLSKLASTKEEHEECLKLKQELWYHLRTHARNATKLLGSNKTLNQGNLKAVKTAKDSVTTEEDTI